MTEDSNVVKIGPQPGPQTQFLQSPAQICIYGGSAGSGKSYALLLSTLRHIDNSKFRAIIFRRTSPQITNPGALWDESTKLFGQLDATPYVSRLKWVFNTGASVEFSHLERKDTVLDYQGAQIDHIYLDELNHFEESQFWYMLSRNRSVSGVPSRIRATTNPSSEGFVRELVDWWIDEDGYPIPERSGVIRWFARFHGELHWGDSPEELKRRLAGDEGEDFIDPVSFTFIPASIYDNPVLLEQDKTYLASLKALNRVDRAQLLEGNWNVRADAGTFFRASDFNVATQNPNPRRRVRSWDIAASKDSGDFTVGTLMSTDGTNYYIEDVVRGQFGAGDVEEIIRQTADSDPEGTVIRIPQDPGQAGKSQIAYLTNLLKPYRVVAERETGKKATRAQPLAAKVEHGYVYLTPGEWHDKLLNEFENFSYDESHRHDDIVDATSGAFNYLSARKPKAGIW